jgi:hypothetical protein
MRLLSVPVDPQGRYVCVVNNGAASVTGNRIEADSGRLKPIERAPFTVRPFLPAVAPGAAD